MTLSIATLKSRLRERLGARRGDMACRLLDAVEARSAGDRLRVSLSDICAAIGPDADTDDAVVVMTVLTQWPGVAVFKFCLDFSIDGHSQEMSSSEYARSREVDSVVHKPTGRIVRDIDRHVYPMMRATEELLHAFETQQAPRTAAGAAPPPNGDLSCP